MPYADPIKKKEYEERRNPLRRLYWREYRRLKPQKYKYNGDSLSYKSEELSLKILKGSEKIIHPVDIKWEGKLVDVKTAIRRVYDTGYNKGKTYYWKFYLKQLRKADLYLIILQDEEKRVVKVLLIPDKVFNTKYLRIAESKLSSYSMYEITS